MVKKQSIEEYVDIELSEMYRLINQEIKSKSFEYPIGNSQKFYKINQSPSPPKPSELEAMIRKSPVEILEPFNQVFFDTMLMDELIVRTSVPQLLTYEAPLFPGVILFGPPGTGKSEFQNALVKVYNNAGAYAENVS